MPNSRDLPQRRSHFERLFRRIGDGHFIGCGYRWIHAKTVDLLPPGARILDVGCGTGHHARRFAARGYEVSGIELSHTAVTICTRVFAKLGLAGAFTCGDVRNLPYEDGAFDGSFLSLILHQFLDYDAVLAEAARVARRYVFVFEPNAWNPRCWLRLNAINAVFTPSWAAPSERAVNPLHVRKVMRSRGYACRATHYVTLEATERYSLRKRLVYVLQRPLPQAMRHSKFVQVYEREAGGPVHIR